jgi:hypothetical protein
MSRVYRIWSLQLHHQLFHENSKKHYAYIIQKLSDEARRLWGAHVGDSSDQIVHSDEISTCLQASQR